MTQTKPFYTRTGKLVDLHDQAVDATGRLDVLAARLVKRAVEHIHDPVVQAWYAQFQPLLDSQIYGMLRKFNVKSTLRELGVAEPPRRQRKRMKRIETRRRPEL